MNGRWRSKGFTLLELLVSLAIFAILATMAYTALNTVMNARKEVEKRAARLTELQTAFMAMERDIEEAVARPVRDDLGDEQPALKGGGVGTNVLMLTRTGWRNPLGVARSDLQRVAYGFTNHQLLRESWGTLDRGPGNEPYQEVLINGVSAVDVRFLGQDRQWLGYWPPESNIAAQNPDLAQMPLAVEISVDVKGWGRIVRLFRVPG
ncbi:MAG: type II secretion system minor pseudopilin GspJ [Gammaproteobacteria bacterium]|jgi:general secretion pathway protein J